jgi:hypothetical protein
LKRGWKRSCRGKLGGKGVEKERWEGLVNKSLMGKMKEKLNLKDKRKKRRK